MKKFGLDIGASKIKYVVFNEKTNKIILSKQINYSSKTKKGFLDLIKKIREGKDLRKFSFKKIGVGVPGIILEKKLVYCPNFPNLLKIDLNKEIRRIFRKPLIFENDANCFAYAETMFGAGKKYNRVLGLTLGSGLGGGIVLNKKIYRGSGWAGEIGHTIIQSANPRAKNKNYEAEDLCSDKFFKNLGYKNALAVRLLAEKGNKKEKKIYEQFGMNLGIVIANAVNFLDIEAVVLGGGISEAYKLFIKKTKQTANKLIINPKSKNLPILKSHFGKSAGAIGASLL